MIVTEHDAAKKLCPFARAFDGSSSPFISDPLVYGAGPYCVGQKCMAWDWIDQEHQAMWFVGNLEQQPGNEYHINVQQPHPKDFENGFADPKYDQAFEDAAVAAGFQVDPANAHLQKNNRMRYKRPHPTRRGQCMRTITIDPDSGS